MKQAIRGIRIASLLMVMLPIQSLAQDDGRSYTAGERVEYRDSLSQVWWPGTIVKLYPPEYKQVLVHWDPRADYPTYTRNGVSIYEAAYTMDWVRHMKARTADKPEVKTDQAKQAYIQGGVGLMTKDEGGTGLMTKEEILGYMKTNATPSTRYDQQVCRDLIEQMKRRGVVEPFKYGSKGDDRSPLISNGCTDGSADVAVAADLNLGTPTTLNWLFGTWGMNVIGGTVDTAPGDGYIYRKNESFAKLGFLTINGNGTFAWKVNPSDPPAKYVKGSWRNATKQEMGRQGGAGIVLLKAAEGYDWIAFKNQAMSAEFKADRIAVDELQSRGSYRRTGGRQ